jgi:GNAT superfamily N-acetyltransferase
MKLVVGRDLEDFKRCYKTGGAWFMADLGVTEENIVKKDPSHLIVFKEDNQIIGHAIWYEANTEEHRKGEARNEKDKEILQKLLGRQKDFVELHELWLKKEYRGKGYGKKFFEFFEEFIANRGCDSIIFYADHPAAIAICRKRGYKEDYGVEEEGRTYYVFHLSLKNHDF